MSSRHIALAVLALAAAETLFWAYTFYDIDRRTNPLGDGLEWIAEVPLTIIVLAGVAPAAVLGFAGLWWRWAGIAGALFAAGALVADAIIWPQILTEFAHKTVH
jgi:hypothetical protein